MRRLVLLLLAAALVSPALAQHRGRGQGEPPNGRFAPPAQGMSSEERQRLREDVNAARGNYARPEPRRQDRMAPEDRERLRRDVQDANRDMRRR